MEPRFQLVLLGDTVRLDGPQGPVPLRVSALALLSYLALAGPTPRDRIAGLLWPEHRQPRARANLRQLLHRLRAVGDVVTGDPPRLGPAVAVDADALLRSAADRADAVPAAGTVWAQLAPLDVGDRPDLDEWLALARERFRERVVTALAAQVDRHEARAAPEAALATARCWLAFDPYAEAAHRRLILAYMEADDPRAALSAFRRCRTLLARALDVEPSEATLALAEEAARRAARPFGLDASIDAGSANPRSAFPVQARVRAGARAPAVAGPVSTSPGPLVRRAETGGWSAEGLALLDRAAHETRAAVTHARLLVGIAWLEHQRGRRRAARAAARRGLSLLRRANVDDPAVTEALFLLGSLARARGDDAHARRCWSAALARLARGHGRRAALALHLNMGLVEDGLGASEEAARHYLNALSLAEALGERRTAATVLNNLGHGLVQGDRPEDGAVLLARAHGIARELGDRQLQGYALDGLARARLATHDPREARALSARALRAALELDDHELRIEALLTLAHAQRELDEPEAAAKARRAAWRLAQEGGDRPRVRRFDGAPPGRAAHDRAELEPPEAGA